MEDVIEVIEAAFVELAQGTTILPPRTVIALSQKVGWMGVMPAYLEKIDSLSTKIVTVFATNVQKNLPTVLATILLNDPETGVPLAIMDGTHITAMRTGAVGGVAAKYLAREDSKIVGVFGAGVQARTQLTAVCEVREVEQALVCSRTKKRAKAFASTMFEQLEIPIDVCKAEELVKASDIIITATTSRTPIFNGNLVKEGTHLNVIGSYTPETREVDRVVIQRSKIVVDRKSAALEEAGDIIIPLNAGYITEEEIYAELGDIITGQKPGRTSNSEITLFKSVGLGIQDCATARLAYEKAQALGLLKDVDLFL